jgi:hypothetical protein
MQRLSINILATNQVPISEISNLTPLNQNGERGIYDGYPITTHSVTIHNRVLNKNYNSACKIGDELPTFAYTIN